MNQPPLIRDFEVKLYECMRELNPENAHETLISFIDINITTLDKALQTNQLHPFYGYSHTLSGSLKALREIYWKMGYYFKHSRDERTTSLIGMLNQKIPEVERREGFFGFMKDCLMKHIQLEILPNEVFDEEKIYLSNGYVFIPIQQPKLYTTLKVSPTRLDEKTSLDFELLEKRFSSLDDAMRNYVDKDLISTVAVAKNTEFYPLLETSLPIVKEKYQQGLSH